MTGASATAVTTPHLPTGTHAVADCHGVSPDKLGDLAFWEQHTREAARRANAVVLRFDAHHFGEGQGIAGVLLLAESHLSFHTWPEHGFAALDAFMCGDSDPKGALEYLAAQLGCTDCDLRVMTRGRPAPKA